MKLRHLIAVSTCAAVGGLVFAGCGDGDNALEEGSRPTDARRPVDTRSTADPLDRLRIAEERTKAQGSADIDVEMAAGVGDQHLTLTLSGTGDMTGGAADLDMEINGGGLDADLHLVTESETVWFTEDDQTWYSMPASEFGEDSQAPTSLDASEYLAFLEGVGGEITDAGVEQIDGQPATHYEAEIDVASLAEATDSDVADLKEAGLTTLPFDVWIGDDDLVRRVAVHLDTDLEGSHVELDIQADFSNFRDDVEVTTPPAGEIVPGSSAKMAELLGA